LAWVVIATPQSLYPWEREPVSIVHETECDPERKISPQQGFDPWIVKAVESSYTDYAIPAHSLVRPPTY
jgi:hypothetical protein